MVTVSDGKGGTAVGSGSLQVQGGGSGGIINGTAALAVGQNGDLSNMRVAIYADLVDYQQDNAVMFDRVQGSGSSVSFTLTNVPPGSYYLDVWKDIDNSQTINLGSGDFYGIYGNGVYPNGILTRFTVNAGQTTNVNTVTVYVLN